ncbi:LOG family protein [Saccharothrix sp. Mg75]|uniref:LOG family protein n=1 Tax=Saccharothrix sp. Mg75 TaxID=3445357 RepID=UPI003EEBEA91
MRPGSEALVGWEVAHEGLTELHVVAGLHERKAMMTGLSDAVLALPGGAGTLDELFEAWTWAQLKVHTKPVGVHNVAGRMSPRTLRRAAGSPRRGSATRVRTTRECPVRVTSCVAPPAGRVVLVGVGHDFRG